MPRKSRANTKKAKVTRKHTKKEATQFLPKFVTTPQFKKSLGIIFVVLGLLLFYKIPVIKSPVSQKVEPITASSSFKSNNSKSDIERILIGSAGIDLPVTPSKIVGGYWQTSDTTASHGDGSANPGTSGNVVIFAHARIGLFYNLKDVKKDDTIYVLTTSHWYRYKVGTITAVYPNDITVVAPSKKEVLTLFTCSGFYDEKRLIVKAYPIN